MVPPVVVHSGSSPNNGHYIQQFLCNVLSQRGPSALPYSEDVKWLIRQHLLSLTTDAYPSLQPKTATYTHNDGRTVNLLQADGTVPMPFQGINYNIPIVIWLMESYPRHSPLVYVNPTRDMIIKRPHPFVSPSGIVSTPYLQNWVYPSSNLLDLARELSHYFGCDPPLYSQRSLHNQNPSSNFTSSTDRPPRSHSDDPTEVFKRNAINKVGENLHSDVGALRKTREAEMEGMFNAQAVLWQREKQLARGLREMLEEKDLLEQQLQMVLMNADVLEGWLRENEGKLAKTRNVEFKDDAAFEPCDALSKQMLDVTASDLAIEDVIYSLDKAVQEGLIPIDQYLRNVRLLSREQFFHRATTFRVRAAQMQAQVSSMAARALQRAV